MTINCHAKSVVIAMANSVIATTTLKRDTDSIKRIHVAKYIVMTVSVFLVFPLLVYWVASPNVVVHTNYRCINANSKTMAGHSDHCEQIVAVHTTLTGIRHSPNMLLGSEAVYDHSNSHYTPYSNSMDSANICDVLPFSPASDKIDERSSAARNTCIYHKRIRAGVVAVFVLMTVVAVMSFWLCRVTEGELLKQVDTEGKTPLFLDLFNNLELYKGWRGIVGLVWGSLLAAAVIWQVQVYDNVFSGSKDLSTAATPGWQWSTAPGIGSVAFGAGVTKAMQIYLWFLFSLFTFKVIVNRYSIINNLIPKQGHAGVELNGGFILGLDSNKMDGVAVELAQTNRPQLTMDPDKLNTHNALMRKTLS